jgi:hypothetical protein
MAEWVMKCVERLGGAYNVDGGDMSGLLLATYDPEYRGGRGMALWTEDVDKAMKFPDAPSAWALWRQQSVLMPLREDGYPNRPLTAYSVEVLRIEDL